MSTKKLLGLEAMLSAIAHVLLAKAAKLMIELPVGSCCQLRSDDDRVVARRCSRCVTVHKSKERRPSLPSLGPDAHRGRHEGNGKEKRGRRPTAIGSTTPLDLWHKGEARKKREEVAKVLRLSPSLGWSRRQCVVAVLQGEHAEDMGLRSELGKRGRRGERGISPLT